MSDVECAVLPRALGAHVETEDDNGAAESKTPRKVGIDKPSKAIKALEAQIMGGQQTRGPSAFQRFFKAKMVELKDSQMSPSQKMTECGRQWTERKHGMPPLDLATAPSHPLETAGDCDDCVCELRMDQATY